MKSIRKYIFIYGLLIALGSCDAIITLDYRVKNKTNKSIKLKIDDYHTPIYWGYPFGTVDTIVELKPKQSIIVGQRSHISFPFATKSLYHEQPGINNFKVINGDSLFSVNTEDKYWKYWHKTSTFKIKKHTFQKTISSK